MPYSAKFREKMVAKMTGPRARSATALSREVGVSQGTLSRWLREAKEGRVSNENEGGSRRRWSPEEKVRIVMEAAALGDDELGAFLRREGLHEADLERMCEEVREAATEGLRPKRRRRGLSPEQKKIRRLERELTRKDKALAEAAALLVLRKKAEAFFLGEEEGDTMGSSDE
jgi:transposase